MNKDQGGVDLYRVLAAEWFTAQGGPDPVRDFVCLGMVAAMDMSTGKPCVYFGVGHGLDQAADIARIIKYGSKVSPERFQHFFGRMILSLSPLHPGEPVQ